MNFNEMLQRKNRYMSGGKNRNYCQIFNKEEIEYFYEYIHKELHVNQQLSIAKISKLVNTSRSNLIMQLRKRNFINRSRLLKFRENLFEEIKTEEDAYWLGFIYADGNILDKGYFVITLKHTDYNHLLKFADYCKFDKSKIIKKANTNFPNSYYCKIGFSTKHLKQRFFDLGIIPRKSLVLTYPDFLSEDLHKHFIRGYFDGDGSFGVYKYKNNTKKRVNASMMGTLAFLEEVIKKIPVDFPNIYNKNKNSQLINLSREKAKNWITWMYDDATIYLDRKYNRYLKMIEFYK